MRARWDLRRRRSELARQTQFWKQNKGSCWGKRPCEDSEDKYRSREKYGNKWNVPVRPVRKRPRPRRFSPDSPDASSNDLDAVNQSEGDPSDDDDDDDDQSLMGGIVSDGYATFGDSFRSSGSDETDGSISDSLGDHDAHDATLKEDILEENFDILEGTRSEVQCRNCRRKGQGIVLQAGDTPSSELEAYMCLTVKEVVSETINTRKALCHLRKRDLRLTTTLCWQCLNCICGDNEETQTTRQMKNSLYGWPSFIWNIFRRGLRATNVAHRFWRMLPICYRRWWFDNIRFSEFFDTCSITTPAPVTRECTAAMRDLSTEIADLVATRLFPLFDRYSAMPLVKCPWGCSEFLNRCNKLPLDVLLLEGLDTATNEILTITPSGREEPFLRGIRSDFLQSDHCILANAEWRCRPSICFDVERGPQFLCCRFHSRKTRGKMIHVPREPFGAIASRGDNQYAQAVARPRTVGYSHRNTFTDSYHLSVANGRYEGIDTMYLTNFGRYDRGTMLSSTRDALQFQTRPDIQVQLRTLVETGCVPSVYADDLMEYSQRIFPPNVLRAITKRATGGTYVDMESAMALESSLRNETQDSIELHETGELCSYRPNWVKHILYVHEDDEYGSPFPSLPHMCPNLNVDLRILWVLVAMLCSCRELWFSVAGHVNTTNDWEGWVLAYSFRQCYTEHQCTGSKNNPFSNVKSVTDLITMIQDWSGVSDSNFIPAYVHELFAEIETIHVSEWSEIWDKRNWSRNIKPEATILLVSNDIMKWNAGSFGEPLPLEHRQWELRVVITSETTGSGQFESVVMSRHGCFTASKWWKRHHMKSPATKWRRATKMEYCPSSAERSGDWTIAIYVAKTMPSYKENMIKYLECAGFQTKLRCKTHRDPLLVAVPSLATGTYETCQFCDKRSDLCCAHPGCSVRLCKNHGNELTDTGCSEPIYLCPRVSEEDGPRCHSDEDSIFDSANSTKSSKASNDASSGASYFSASDSDDLNGYESASTQSQIVTIRRSDGWRLQESFSDESTVESGDMTPDMYDGEDIFATGQMERPDYDGDADDLMHSTADTVVADRQVHEDVDQQITTSHKEDNGEAFTGDAYRTHDENPGHACFHGTWGENCILFDNHAEGAMDSEQDHQLEDSECFFTTHTGKPIYRFQVEQDSIGSHVIFNKHARLLVRRKQDLSLTRRQKRWIQKIICTASHEKATRSVPLLYTEGTLYPSVFWRVKPEGSIIGALPTALLSDNATLKRLGFATLHDHMRTRLTDTSLLCSTDDSYLSFAFDSCANLGTRGHDTRVHMKRGWDPTLTKGEGINCRNSPEAHSETHFDTEQVDNKIVCNKVAAALCRKMGTLFYTVTANQKLHFGTRILKAYLDNENTVFSVGRHIFGKDNISRDRDIEHLRQEILDSSSTLALRVWENAWCVFRQYLMDSPEEPLGAKVQDMVDRAELQDGMKAGHIPHHHLILWLCGDDGTFATKMKFLSNIRGSISSIVDSDEIEQRIDEGIVRSYDHLVMILDDLERFLVHKHTRRCLIPSGKDGIGKGELPTTGDMDVDDLLRQGYKCKVRDNHRVSPNRGGHTFRKLEMPHCAKAREILAELGLLRKEVNEFGTERDVLDDRLVAISHIPPTTAEHGIVSPVPCKLALLNPSNQNVQSLDSVLTARYLTKYVIMMDEANRIWVRPPTPLNRDTLTCGVEALPNTKISSVAKDIKKKKEKTRDNYIARVVGSPEIAMLLLNMEQIYMTQRFVHIATGPLEERPAFDRTRPLDLLVANSVISTYPSRPADLDTSRLVFSQHARKSWPNAIRQFSTTALIQAADDFFSPLSIDSVTVFSMRPPELYWVRNQKLYHECFVRSSIRIIKDTNESYFDAVTAYCANQLNPILEECAWIDATFQKVTVRRAAIPLLVKYIQDSPANIFNAGGMPGLRQRMLQILIRLSRDYETSISAGGFRTERQNKEWLKRKTRFLSDLESHDVPIGFYSNIRPALANRFLIHILLSMGQFTTELDLQLCGTIRRAYIHAGLFDPSNAVASVNQILSSYLLDQMPAHAASTRSKDEMLITAKDVLTAALIENIGSPSSGMPPVMYTRIQLKCSDEARAFIADTRRGLAQTALAELQKCGIPDLPSIDAVVDATLSSSGTPPWSVDRFAKTPRQSDESFAEQKRILEQNADALRQLVSENHLRHPKSCCTVGGPGCGKTSTFFMTMLHSLCMGLLCMATALLSDRASSIGGIHVHRLFCIPVQDDEHFAPGKIAEAALANLYSFGLLHVELLKRLDVLFFDELGQNPALTVSVVDMILRRLRQSNLIFGGVLVFGTYDILQIPPINSLPPLMSGHMMTSFRFLELSHSVRASRDAGLRELQRMTRLTLSELTPTTQARFISLFASVCSFVNSFDDPRIPTNAVYCFGRKAPGKRLRDAKLALYSRDLSVARRTAFDEECTHHSRWKEASAATTSFLDQKTKEDNTLYFVKGLVYETTQYRRNCYNTHQLCVLWDVPPAQRLNEFAPVAVLLAPSGVKNIPSINTSTRKEDLLSLPGWREVKIHPARPQVHRQKRGVKSRRRQYALKLHMTTTLHGAMGYTYSAICSKVESNPSSPYHLWERSQAIVLLSRTEQGSDMYFVGDPIETAKAILQVLLKRSQYSAYMDKMLHALLETGEDNTPFIEMSHHPFRPVDIELPTDSSGFCYLIVSCKEPDVTYIGETPDIGKRLDSHNAGSGAMQTRSVLLRPWALYSFVAGFDYDENKRLTFQDHWQHARDDFRTRNRRKPNPQQITDIAAQLVRFYNSKGDGSCLRLIMCSTMPPLQP